MKIKSITDTYKKNNEDVYGMTEHCFWVLDGALPLSKANYTSNSNDVVWMVNWWNKYLSNHIERLDKSIIAILEEGVDLLNAAFSQFADINTLSKLDRASAGIVIVRINGETVENYVLGDTEINVRTKDNKIQTLTDEMLTNYDKQVIDMIFNNNKREDKIIFNGYTDEELEVLRINRMKMNTNKGYYILEHDKSAIKHGIYKTYKLPDILDILLMSDGYSSIYNKYNQLTKKQLMDACKNDGLEGVLSKIRKIEDDDSDFKTHKRLRLHDDATAIYINI